MTDGEMRKLLQDHVANADSLELKKMYASLQDEDTGSHTAEDETEYQRSPSQANGSAGGYVYEVSDDDGEEDDDEDIAHIFDDEMMASLEQQMQDYADGKLHLYTREEVMQRITQHIENRKNAV